MENVIFKTENNHAYSYAFNNKEFIYLHPIIKFFIDIQTKGTDLSKFIKTTNKFRIINNKKINKDELNFYAKKFKFYWDNELLNNRIVEKEFNAKYISSQIDYNLANISQILFEVTEKCNLDCKYCCYGELYEKTNENRNKSLPISHSKKVIDFFFNIWQSNLNSSINDEKNIAFYGGEPLTNFNFIKNIIEYITLKQKDNKVKIKYQITTNGTLLDKYIDFLVKNNFRINVSLDGDSENDKYRVFHNGDKSFNVVFNNLLLVKRKYPQFFDEHFGFQVVLNETSNIKKILDFYKSKLNIEKHKIQLSGISKDNIKDDKKVDLEKMLFSGNASKNIPIDKAVQFMLALSDNSIKSYAYMSSKSMSVKENLLPTGTCSPFQKKIFITSRGNLLPCERISFDYFLGNVNDLEVSLDINEIARRVNIYFDSVRELCSKCYKNSNCERCIYHVIEEKEQGTCSGFYDKKKFEMFLSKIFLEIESNKSNYCETLKEIRIEA